MLKLVLFDHDDLDAAGCRIVFQVAHHHLKEGVDYKIVHCSNVAVDDIVKTTLEDENIDDNTEIYFSDIVASREVMEMIAGRFKTVKVWDHHRTNFYVTWVIPDAVIIPENACGVLESGTSLMFKHFCELAAEDSSDPRALHFLSNDLTETSCTGGCFEFFSDLVENIRSYDTYDWKETNNITAKKLQTLFFLLGMDKFCKRYVDRIIKGVGGDVIGEADADFVDARLENEQRIIDSIGVDDIYDVSVRGYRAAFILSSAGANISELSHQFLKKHPEFDIFMGFTFTRGGEYSFRCIRDDINVGEEIALPIGGGGHPKAAGASIPAEVIECIIHNLLSGIDDQYHMTNYFK